MAGVRWGVLAASELPGPRSGRRVAGASHQGRSQISVHPTSQPLSMAAVTPVQQSSQKPLGSG